MFHAVANIYVVQHRCSSVKLPSLLSSLDLHLCSYVFTVTLPSSWISPIPACGGIELAFRPDNPAMIFLAAVKRRELGEAVNSLGECLQTYTLWDSYFEG